MISGNSRQASAINVSAMKPHIFNPSRRAIKGIEVVYQDLALCYTLWAAANVFLGQEFKRNPSRSTLGRWRGA
jgi:simple sugar transport system ATP-binding protein